MLKEKENFYSLREEITPQEAKTAFVRSVLALERLDQKLHEILGIFLADSNYPDLNPVQAQLLYNIGANKLAIGELKSRSFYLGTNVTYNLKKLVKGGYVKQQKMPHDGRSQKVSLTPKGLKVAEVVDEFYNGQIMAIMEKCPLEFREIQTSLKVMETWDRFWDMQIKSLTNR